MGDPLRSQSSDDKPEISGAPALPPRYNKVNKTKSVELPGTAPDVQCKPRPRKKSLPSIPGIPSKPGPPVSTRPRAKTHDCAPKVRHDGETMTPGVQDGTEIDNSPASAPDVIQETDSIPGTIARCTTSGHRYPTSDHRYPTSDHRYPASDHRYPTSDHRYPTSDHRYPQWFNDS